MAKPTKAEMSMFDWMDEEENTKIDTPTGATITIKSKKELKRIKRLDEAKDAFIKLPESDFSTHFISAGLYDFFMLVELAIEKIGKSKEFYASTWTINREYVLRIFELYDSGAIGSINFLSGVYFKSRETAVYAQLLNGVRERGQRYRAFQNHAKVVLLQRDDDYIVIEGSANFTGNPRTENFTITNSKELYLFHRKWFDEMLK